jgi:hypothetical protein
MLDFQNIKEIQRLLQGRNFVHLRTAFGANFVQWFDIFQRVIFVAKKLSRPHSVKVSKSYSRCFRLLTEYRWSQNDWDSELFQQTLEQFNQDFSRLFFQIVAGVIGHPEFSEIIQGSRRWFREESHQALNPDPNSPNQQITIFVTRSVIDSLAGMATKPSQVG